ncbi:Mini-ribonuclease 3 [Fusibacter ferrireducens]|uniref:Mini-ribonuclease 3 n=1 Tax=Fusibacter ferrireducens TaxID=2785058 RepID=A0ABS0A0A4_9FIRM|nr:ribonuclease III domain-containing protein [Fusibacter ferrireducens]MBF4695868.1 Mini-ribonuclease 3 [Fusibacter ferrireducens]
MNEFLETLKIDMLKQMDVQMLNPLKLAYLGDAVYEAYIRTYIISKYTMTPNEMSKLAVKYVKASAQAKIVLFLQDELSEAEWTIVKRGRNQKSGSVPKNAILSDYKYATGFEALIGYLYLTGEKTRIYQIIGRAIEIIEMPEAQNQIKDQIKDQNTSTEET